MKFSFANLIAEAHLIKLDVYKLDFTTDTHTPGLCCDSSIENLFQS